MTGWGGIRTDAERGALAGRASLGGAALAALLLLTGVAYVAWGPSEETDAPALVGPALARVEPAQEDDGRDGNNGGPPCTKVLTDVASLASTLSAAGPSDVTCIRGGSGATPQRSQNGPTKQLRIWLTGYSWQDNTPPGSAKVSQPVLHKEAGGEGTFDDPITVAVPGKGGGIFKSGAKFYLPTVQRYVIVEDTGASAAPSGQDGHLDMWIGGKGGTRSATDACMDKITAKGVPAEHNPPPDRPVIKGPIYADNRCNIPGGRSRN
ncbi:hypothetical protein [Pseudonocardia acaciae]|uniref:hypothetical protein n=1 Tax=Pseudonocardia acaciae TaxID=551276 RepID=UPI000687F7E4|nr:hypothetical protein [Pseudonocardia acaciae]